jgi:4,5-dihydroxyphthalate decarboxylase
MLPFIQVSSGLETVGSITWLADCGASSNTWIRGMLQDQYGVAPADMHWIETTKSSDTNGVVDESSGGGSRYQLPDEFPLEFGPPGVDESELLLGGGCDALITAITPKAVLDGNPKIRQLFTAAKSAEQKYFRETGLFPIMHVVAVRRDVAEDKPWLPAEVFRMYSEAKKVAYNNLEATTVLRTSLPWTLDEYEETTQLMGKDYWRYGIDANRKELELVMRYAHEQGLVTKLGNFQDMFLPSTLDLHG